MIVVVLAARALPADDETGPTSEITGSHESAPAIFGVVVRLSEEVFRSPDRFIRRTEPVSQTIVGVYNAGTAQVTGEVIPDLRPRQNGVRLDLVFRGTSVSRTVSREQGARIDTSTTTDVRVATPITFDLKSGFVAGRSHAEAVETFTHHRVNSEVCGLRGLIIRRVARNRVEEQKYQIRSESTLATRNRAAARSREEVEEQVRRLNAQLDPWRQFLISQPWFRPDSTIQYSSDERHVILSIRGERPRLAPQPSAEQTIDFPPPQLPPPVRGGLVDVIFYGDTADQARVAALLNVVKSFIDEYTADMPVADRLSFETTEGPDWVKLSVSRKPDE